eukprot:2732044-Pyramimonas_sp.AAC.1
MGVLAGCSCCCELLLGVKGVTGGKMLGLGVGCSVGMGESAAVAGESEARSVGASSSFSSR